MWTKSTGSWAGSLQSDLLSYRRSYHHAVWVSSMLDPSDSDRVRFFYDYVDEYLMAQVPQAELNDAVRGLSNRLDRETLSDFQSTFETLTGAAYNIKEAAARLSVHRNTVLHRLTRFRELCGMDPVHNHADRKLLSMIYHQSNSNIVH